MPQSLSYYHKKILFFSIIVSVAMHIAEVHFLQSQAFWLASKPVIEKSKNDWSETLEQIEKDQILKESFTRSEIKENPKLKKGVEASKLQQTVIEESLISVSNLEAPENPLSLEAPAFSDMHPWRFEPPLISFEEQIELVPSLPREFILPTLTCSKAQTEPIPQEPLNSIRFQLQADAIQPPKIENQKNRPEFEPSWINPIFLSSSIPTPKFPLSQNMPTLSELHAASCSNAFETEVVYSEINDGYLFAITLIPKSDLQLPLLKQNYLFLIDRSNSIQKERLNATKSAVRRAIDELNKNDQFNIVVFDQKVDKLSPSMLPVCQESTYKAHQFLNNIQLGSFFSHKNLNKPLFLTIPHNPKNDELFTAILITDGENLSQKSAIQGLVDDWTRVNQGKVSLYTLGMIDDQYLNILDTISNMNRGKNFSSPTYRGLKRKLLKIMKTVHRPIAKNLNCKAIGRTTNQSIELYPKPNHAPHLYAGEPYVILGTAKTLDDFVLFVQAKLDNEWLHIKKNICFERAKKGDAKLASEIAQFKSFDSYQRYLEGKGLQCLNEAKTLLKAYDHPSIFENL